VRYELNMNTYLYIFQDNFRSRTPCHGSGGSSPVFLRGRSGFEAGSVLLFVVDKVELWRSPPSLVLRLLSSVSMIALMLHTRLHINADF